MNGKAKEHQEIALCNTNRSVLLNKISDIHGAVVNEGQICNLLAYPRKLQKMQSTTAKMYDEQPSF